MLKAIRFVPPDTKIPFVAARRTAFVFSLILILGSLGALFAQGLNFGIDFRGGILMEVQTPGAADVPGMRSILSGLDLGEVNIQEFGTDRDVLVRIQRQDGAEREQMAAIELVKQALGPSIDYRRTEFVGPTVGEELKEAGMLAVGLALLSILLYIWFRFEWQFGVGAIAALSHDILTTIGLFALLQHEFNLATVAAVLTIAGYSINDTVVVYDRVRENLRKYKRMDLAKLFNLSINQTLSRTTMTSVTTLLALLAIFFFGGEVLADFALAMIWGVCIGTYSSVFIAVPLLLYTNLKRNEEPPSGISVPQDERIEDG
ncbi:MAG: protein translocase subunit SecF [Rhodospirillaceae bacterium]|nr:protein translocase subunit SecF [Rhodospirillaceae bacterium]